MEIVLLIIGLGVGTGIGMLVAGRKATALKAQLEAAQQREDLLNRTTNERIEREKAVAEERLKAIGQQSTERLAAQEKQFGERLAEQERLLPTAWPNRSGCSMNRTAAANNNSPNDWPNNGSNWKSAWPNSVKRPKHCTAA